MNAPVVVPVGDAAASTVLVARALRVRRLATWTFADCWACPRRIQVVAAASLGRIHAGALLRVTGTLRAREDRAGEIELLASELTIVNRPERPAGWVERWTSDERRSALLARSAILAAIARRLEELGFFRFDATLFRDWQAAEGSSTPFRVASGAEPRYLPVTNLLEAGPLHAAGVERIYQLSRLFWQHRSNCRQSLNEICLAEMSAPLDRSAMMSLVEDVYTCAAEAASEHVRPAGIAPSSFHRAPVLTYAEVVDACREAGVALPGGHVLPARADAVVAARIGTSAYWMIDAPAEVIPAYAAQTDGTALSMEMRTVAVPNIGSGSEIAGLVGPAEAGAAGPWSGFSIGLDRLVLAVSGLTRIRSVASTIPSDGSGTPRAAGSGQGVVAVSPRPGRETPAEPTAQRHRERAEAGRVLRVRLERAGFLPVSTSLFGTAYSAWADAGGGPTVDYFDEQVPVVTARSAALHRLLHEGLDRVYEFGRVADDPPHDDGAARLDVAAVAMERDDLAALAMDLLRAWSDVRGSRDPAFARAVASLRVEDLRSPRDDAPQYALRNADGSWRAFEWSWGGRRAVHGTVWPFRRADLAAAGRADVSGEFLAFLDDGPPPAGGLAIDLDALP